MDLEHLSPFTTVWIAGSVCLTLLEHLGFVSEHQLFFSTYYIFKRHQYWRFITTFMYFGRFGLMFALRMLDLVRFAYPLEAQTFGPTRQAQFAWLLLCASIVLLLLSRSCQFTTCLFPCRGRWSIYGVEKTAILG